MKVLLNIFKRSETAFINIHIRFLLRILNNYIKKPQDHKLCALMIGWKIILQNLTQNSFSEIGHNQKKNVIFYSHRQAKGLIFRLPLSIDMYNLCLPDDVDGSLLRLTGYNTLEPERMLCGRNRRARSVRYSLVIR